MVRDFLSANAYLKLWCISAVRDDRRADVFFAVQTTKLAENRLDIPISVIH